MKRSRAVVVESPRLAERRRAVRAERRRRGVKVALLVVLLVSLSSGAWALSRSSLFGVSSITVAGVERLGERQVVTASGIRLGESAVALDLAAAAERVRALPGVLDARVERAGALGVRIVVRERVAALEVRTPRGRWYFDGEGVLLPGKGSRARLPFIEISSADPEAAGPPWIERGAVRTIVAAWKALPRSLRTEARRFDAPVAGVVSFRVGGTKVILGDERNLEEKVRAIRLVFKRVGRERLRLLDVRVPSRPAARVA